MYLNMDRRKFELPKESESEHLNLFMNDLVKCDGTCDGDEGMCMLLTIINWSKNIQRKEHIIPRQFLRPSTEENIRNQFKCSDLDIAQYLESYVLTPAELKEFGFPVRLQPHHSTVHVNYTAHPRCRNTTMTNNRTKPYRRPEHGFYKKVECTRCCSRFVLNQYNEYYEEEKCIYHPGKYLSHPSNAKIWSCCQGDFEMPGCHMTEKHAWTGIDSIGLHELKDSVCSKQPQVATQDEFHGVYALDCEMCYTQNGLEVFHVAVVDMNGKIVYTTYVKPKGEMIDHNTRLNSITADGPIGIKTFEEMQKDLEYLIHEDTILIGHSLENDLTHLRFSHNRCIDSSILINHPRRFPYRYSLKYLTKQLLHRKIQTRRPHDPAQDARAALDLVLLKCYTDNFPENDILSNVKVSSKQRRIMQ